MPKLAVFPASGKLGTKIFTHLLKIMEPKNLVFILRDPSKGRADWREAGVTVRTADYDSPGTFERVFDDVLHLVLISYPSIQDEHRFDVCLRNGH